MKGEIIFFQLYMPICNNSIHNSLCSLQMWYIMRKLQREGPQMQKNIPSFSSSLSTPSLVVPKPYVSVNCSRVSSNAQKSPCCCWMLCWCHQFTNCVVQLNVLKILPCYRFDGTEVYDDCRPYEIRYWYYVSTFTKTLLLSTTYYIMSFTLTSLLLTMSVQRFVFWLRGRHF